MTRHPLLEILKDTVDVYLSAAVIEDFVGGENTTILLVDFLSVISEGSIKRIA